MNKKILIITGSIILTLSIIALIVVSVLNKKNEESNSKIQITYNTFAENEETKKIVIENKEEIKTLQDYLKIISLSDKVNLNLALLNEVVIEFGNNESIIVQTSVEDYCYYKNGNTHKLVKMPDGFLEFIRKAFRLQ